MKKKLFVVKAGLGNQIQQTGIYLDLVDLYGNVDIAVYEESRTLSEYFKQVAGMTGNNCFWFDYKKGKPVFWTDGVYDGVISCLNVPYQGIPILYQAEGTHTGNEVRWYERLYHKIKAVKKNQLPIDWKAIRGDMMRKDLPEYDVLICNGSVNKFNWIRKRYQNWDRVISALKDKGYSVGCVGLANEYVYPADDLTEQGLLRTFDLISNCKLFLSNDTGLYHFANAIGKPNIVMFTATSLEKNYNSEFHKEAVVFHPDCECFPCQQSTWGQGRKWRACGNWHCSELNPSPVIKTALRMLKGKRVKPINPIKPVMVGGGKPLETVKEIVYDSRKHEQKIKTILSLKKGEKPETWKHIPDELIDRMWFEGNQYVVKLKNGRCWKWNREKK